MNEKTQKIIERMHHIANRRLDGAEAGDVWDAIAELERLAKVEDIISECMNVMPFGNIKTHTPENLPGRIEELAAEVARLSSVVEALPKTADGVAVVPGMETFRKYNWAERPVVSVAVMSVASLAGHGDDSNLFSNDYSTEAAALAAQEASRA